MEEGRRREAVGRRECFYLMYCKCFLSLLIKKKTLGFYHMDKVLLLFTILKGLAFSRKLSVTTTTCVSLSGKRVSIFIDLGYLVSIPLSRVLGASETL